MNKCKEIADEIVREYFRAVSNDMARILLYVLSL